MRGFLKKLFAKIFGVRRGVYYVNGPDVLPAPLSPEEETAALAVCATNEEARAALIEHNLRLVVYIARRFESPVPAL